MDINISKKRIFRIVRILASILILISIYQIIQDKPIQDEKQFITNFINNDLFMEPNIDNFYKGYELNYENIKELDKIGKVKKILVFGYRKEFNKDNETLNSTFLIIGTKKFLTLFDFELIKSNNEYRFEKMIVL